MEPKRTGSHVLAALLGFFGVMFLVNGFFVYCALSTFGGIDTPDAYRKGLAYNATLAAAGEQVALGWSARLDYVADAGTLALTVTDGTNRPMRGLVISGRLFRPTTDRFDRALGAFNESSPGFYTLRLDGIAAGAWIADLEARGAAAGTTSYRMRERLWLTPKS